MFCKNCGEQADGTFCVNCGFKIEKNNILDNKSSVKTHTTKFCTTCGTELEGGYCNNCSNNTRKDTVVSKSSFNPVENAKPILKKVNSVVESSTESFKENSSVIKTKVSETSETIKEKASVTTSHLKKDIAKYVELGKDDNIIFHILLALLILVTSFNYIRITLIDNMTLIKDGDILSNETYITLLFLITVFGSVYLNTHFRKKNINISDLIFGTAGVFTIVYGFIFYDPNFYQTTVLVLLGLFFFGKMKTVKAVIAVKFEGSVISEIVKKLSNYNALVVVSTFVLLVNFFVPFYTFLNLETALPTSPNIILSLNILPNVIMIISFYLYMYSKISFKQLIFWTTTCSIIIVFLIVFLSGGLISDFTKLSTYLFYGLVLFNIVLIWYVIKARSIYTKED